MVKIIYIILKLFLSSLKFSIRKKAAVIILKSNTIELGQQNIEERKCHLFYKNNKYVSQ